MEYAETTNTDLLIIGTHGRRGFRRLMVAEEIIRMASMPILLIRPKNLLEKRDRQTHL